MAACLLVATEAAALDEKYQKAWFDTFDAIDTGGSVGVGIDLLLLFVPGNAKIEKIAGRIAAKYTHAVRKSARARGMKIPETCQMTTIDGAQIDRIITAANMAQSALKRGNYAVGYDILLYGLIPWENLDCRVKVKQEIFRVRGWTWTV